MSPMQRKRIRSYIPIAKSFLARPENKYCAICKIRKLLGEKIRIHNATEVHHKALRYGTLLFNEEYFAPSCRGCRLWPHDNKTLAKEHGLLVSVPSPHGRNGYIPIIGKK